MTGFACAGCGAPVVDSDEKLSEREYPSERSSYLPRVNLTLSENGIDGHSRGSIAPHPLARLRPTTLTSSSSTWSSPLLVMMRILSVVCLLRQPPVRLSRIHGRVLSLPLLLLFLELRVLCLGPTQERVEGLTRSCPISLRSA